ncbi:alcohol dehydrogenase catalytic domain-containing protein [Streptomyces sp. NPDC088146]|uniref:alcohol dehydrogenase catalytic domain-containing protein n=1 Tax=Streptomyces sp. NPDC088146 TaxID=3365829 RepID=UPI00381D5FF9
MRSPETAHHPPRPLSRKHLIFHEAGTLSTKEKITGIQIRAGVVEEVGAPFTCTDLEIDAPGPGEKLVRIVASGVCHTDASTRSGDMPLPLPGVLGHEGAGIVEAVGPGVTSPAVSDHVVLGWPFCGECKHCREGEPRYCLSIAPALVAGVRFTGESAGTSGYRRAQVEDQVRNTEAPPRRFGRKGGASVSGLDHPHPHLDAGWLS